MTDTTENAEPAQPDEMTDKAQSEAQGAKAGTAKGEEAPLPPPTFASLVHMLFAQGMMYSGLAANPATGKTERDARLMKLHIDLIEMLEEKTRGNLSSDESGMVGEVLHALRMTYIETLKGEKRL